MNQSVRLIELECEIYLYIMFLLQNQIANLQEMCNPQNTDDLAAILSITTRLRLMFVW